MQKLVRLDQKNDTHLSLSVEQIRMTADGDYYYDVQKRMEMVQA